MRLALVEGEHYRTRPGKAEDTALICDAWRRSYSGPWSDFAGSPDLETYKRTQAMAIDLALASSEVLVACDPTDEDVVIGWICFRRPNVLHYVHVKHDFRGNGLGRALFEAAFGAGVARVYATHVHTVTYRTTLTTRRSSDGSIDRERPVPVWRAFGARVHFSPWMVFG